MKFIIVIAAIAFAIFLGMKGFGGSSTASVASKYSLSTVENTPIPNATAITLWREKAQAFCRDFTPNDVEITKRTAEQCVAEVNQKHSACAATLSHEYPDLINNKTDIKHMGKAYFACTLPKPTGN